MALDFNTEPYFDDYNSAKDFYRVLFRPSYAVQARELTQLQTILQNQVSRFGDHVFKNGSQVIPGSVNVDNKVHFIKLEQFTGTLDVTTYIETLKNKVVTGETSGVKMVVVDTSGGGTIVDNLDEPTLYCKVIGTADDNVTNRLIPGENLVALTADNQLSTNYRLAEDQLTDIPVIVKATGSAGEEPSVYLTAPTSEFPNPESSNVLGYAYSVEVKTGIYYVDGIFVRNDDLKLYVGRFTNRPSYRVGFKVTEEYITPEDDESILDNATGSYNFAAPGAHRYKISLSLVKLPLTGTDTFKFIELVRVVDGRIQYKIERSSYAELEKTLARRTFDESGNYEVNKFKVSSREHLNDGKNQGVYPPLVGVAESGVVYGDQNKFVVVVDPGKAYINGYEVESTASQFLEFNKAREIGAEEFGHVKRLGLQNIGFNYGHYVKVNNLYKYPDISNFEKVYLVKKLQNRPATLSCTVVAGVVQSPITIIDGGEGYGSAPTIVFQAVSNTGQDAEATATVVDGKITAITLVDGGSGYTEAPFVYANDGGIGLGLAPTASDIIGTARVKAIELNSGEFTSTTTAYKLGLFDVNMFSGYSFDRDVKSVIGTAASNNFSCNISPTLVSVIGQGTSSTSSATITGAGTAFDSVLKVGDIVFLNDTKVGTVQSFNNFTITLTANALVSVTGGRISVFTSTIYEPNYESLLFPVGQTFIKTLKARNSNNTADTVDSSTTVVRRLFGTKNTTTNKVEFRVTDLDETLEFDTDLSNYLLINIDNNRPVNINEANTTFNTTGARQTVYFDKVPNGNYRLIASVNQEEVSAAARLKVLTTNYEKEYVGKNTVSASTIALEYCDIFKLKSVLMTPGDYDAFDPDNAVDITDRYTLDNGQRDTYYGKGKLLLKSGFQSPSGAIQVKYDYFSADLNGSGNYFSVDSYKNVVDYSEIPSHFVTDPTTGKRSEVNLADVIDFRPYIGGLNANTFKPELPKFGSDMIAPTAFYIGRIDKIVLDSVGKFNVINGVPDQQPKEPADPKDGMVIASIIVPPYTQNIGEVVIKQRDNKRYTMRDIGNLERRISNLEYYVTLSLLEKDTADLQITDETTGLDRFKNGFIVDQFTGHGIGDVKNEDYRISVDTQNRVLRPMHHARALEIVEDLISGTDRSSKLYQKTGDVITLPYQEDSFIFNNHATQAMDIHALSMGAFKGQVQLIPEGDNWKSIDRRPDLVAVDDNNYDAIKFMAEELGVTGTKWDEWQTNWTSISTRSVAGETREWVGGIRVTGYETTYTDYVGYNYRNGVETTLTSSVNAQDYGDRVVDVSYIPYMRSRPVTIIAQNLKSKTRFWPFFDNVSVESYFKPADVFSVTRDGQSLMSFDQNDLNDNILADSDRRAYNGRIEPAFVVGDVLTNSTHQPVNITQIVHLTQEAATFDLYVGSTQNIKVGHHVVLFNLDFHNESSDLNLSDLKENQVSSNGVKIIGESDGILTNDNSSKELNLKKFKVTAVSGTKLTLANLDDTLIPAFSSYDLESYDTNKFGKLMRLKASGVVAWGGIVESSDNIGPITQTIHLVNIKNGFAIGETLSGSVNIGNSSSYNGVTINSINGVTSTTVVPTYKDTSDALITDEDGTAVGVFFIPETAELSFRTGERTFKLTDNKSNSNMSFDSIGSAVYYSQGVTLSKERTIVSSRSVEFVQADTYEDTQSLPPVRRTTTSTRQLYQYTYDPLAQTFTVSAEGGCFLTSVDLYFAAKGVRPVSVELRNTDNGVPSSKIIPFSKVTKPASELNVSDDSSVATTFKFKSPIYLQDTETYCFVVMTDEPGTQLWVSEMGGTDIITDNTIAGQPLTGSLYASQNAREWEIHPLLDMKFTLNKAKFDITSTAELTLKSVPPDMINLPLNPFEITPDTNKIRVYAPNHGMLAGQIVNIQGVSEGYYGTEYNDAGIPSVLLNTSHTVSSSGLEKDSFVINLVTTVNGQNALTYKDGSGAIIEGTVANFVKGEYGGTGVRCSSSINMDVLYLKTSDLSFQGTEINYTVKAQEVGGAMTNALPFVANSNYNFPTRMNIRSFENQLTDINGNKQSSVQIIANLYSSNENISPVVDLQQLSAYAISNLINDTASETVNVLEIDKRVLVAGGDLVTADYSKAGTGTISITQNTDTITGTGTSFSTEVVATNIIKKVDGTVIGTVSSVNGSTITLAANYTGTTITNGEFVIQSIPTISFVNENGVGVIKTNIDSSDNLLASAGIGKTLVISNVAGGIDGEYLITNIVEVEDATTYAGNEELDLTKVVLERAFGTTSSFNMTTDNDFEVAVYDKYVSDIGPIGSSNNANYVTRTLSLSEAADSFKIIFDANIVNNTAIKVFYRTWTGNVDLRKVPYTDTGYVSINTDADGKFIERSVDVIDIEPFYNIQIKIVLKSTNPVYVPKIKNFRLLALS